MPVHSQEHHQHGDSFDPNPNPKSPDTPTTTSTTASATATAAASSTSRLLLFPSLNPRFISFVLKSIIMFFVISSFFLILGIVALAVLHLFLSGRRFRRSPAAEAGRGLSPQELWRCLPRFLYSVEVAVDDCAVCLERFREGQPCRRLPDCCHVFHCGCIDRWLSKVPNCPICRADVRLKSDGSHSGASDDGPKPLWSVEVR